METILYVTNKTSETKLNVWSAFPAVYNFGMSSLGFLSVFQKTDSIDGIFTERVFLQKGQNCYGQKINRYIGRKTGLQMVH